MPKTTPILLLLLHLTHEDLRKICAYTSRSFSSKRPYTDAMFTAIRYIIIILHISRSHAIFEPQKMFFWWNDRISRRGGGWNGVVHPPRLKTHTYRKFYLKGTSFPGHSIGGPCQMSRVTRTPVHQTLAMLPYHPHLVMFHWKIQT